jgi:hypothetical protein
VEPFQQPAQKLLDLPIKISGASNIQGQICAISFIKEAVEITSLFMRSVKRRFFNSL